ncbi:PQQ-binding-like beta-propeller repeat protein [Streptomyces yaanensis]|uniref:PQQ-binding-like beta-propeller repeat protein n=1 Tax=Streptomyces yaanensis TaxID=1142239 RepID=A0ABV7SMM7_9ACTN|nr:PQQ-binding-like beta-propeller repeat protein [Streptomyces sp. CGMCC 4.7035]WNC01876.1 PQQ-binding-like beta-propeller repeat protein [Streptomyces sp. CGMCC 4.7035]
MSLRDSDPAEVGGYRIEDRLGSGGMGVVYLARSASGRRLAVKVVHGQYADDDEFRARFSREVAAARRVSGAFTAPVVDADADASRPWMATLYIPGADLGTYVRRNGPLPPERLREVAAGLAEALRDIHRAGVVHRDLKPANVMLADDGPRVIDFGISRAADFAAADVLTQTGRVMGTPPFMSPEQFSSPHDVGPAADIFSLGAVVVYAATGRGPFDSPSPYETATKVVEGAPELDGVPGEFRPFVELCLEKHPKYRPTPDDLLAFLRDGTRPDPHRAGEEPTVAYEPERPRRARRRLAIASAVTALVLAGTAAVAVARFTGHSDERADLPAGWRAWHARAADKDASGPFNRCAAVGTSLVCAGDDIKATRFSLATGKRTWSRPVDSTPDDYSSSEGSIIGTAPGLVYVYANDETEKGKGDDSTSVSHYAVQALDVSTGRVRWTVRTGDGEGATAPDPDGGMAARLPKGILAVYGTDGASYAFLDTTAKGKVRWHHPLPAQSVGCSLTAAASRPYLVCENDTKRGQTTRISALDPATGSPRWTVTAKGLLTCLGRHGGRLILMEDQNAADSVTTYRTVTTLDPATHRLVRVPLARTQPGEATVTLAGGTLYFTLPNGSIRAVSPETGRQAWESNSTVESPGPPLVAGTRIYVASPSGRLAALDRDTGRVEKTRPGRNDAPSATPAQAGARLTLTGDALYVPYGIRSVYCVNVRDL